jgi:hypothetical protein
VNTPALLVYASDAAGRTVESAHYREMQGDVFVVVVVGVPDRNLPDLIRRT